MRQKSSENLFEIIRSRKFRRDAAGEQLLYPFIQWIEDQFVSSRRLVVDGATIENLHERFDGPGKAKDGLKNIRGLAIDANSLWIEYSLPRSWMRDRGNQVDQVGILINKFDPEPAGTVVYPRRPKEPLLILSAVWNFVADTHVINACPISIYIDTAADGPAWHDYLDSMVQSEPLTSWLSQIYKKDRKTIQAQFDRRIISRKNRGVILRAELKRRGFALDEDDEFVAQLEFTQKIELVPNILGMSMLEGLPEKSIGGAVERMQQLGIEDVEP